MSIFLRCRGRVGGTYQPKCRQGEENDGDKTLNIIDS